MRIRKVVMVSLCAALLLGLAPVRVLHVAAAQQPQEQQLSATQRLEVMRSRLETLRRTLSSAISGLGPRDASKEASPDDPRVRLSGLEKETNKLISDVADIRGKQDRAERYDPSAIDKLEAAATDLDTRVQAAMRDTASARTAAPVQTQAAPKEKIEQKKGGFFSRIIPFHGGGGSKYDELVGTVAPGRDRELFSEATKEARHDNYETSRSLYAVIINTYPDSVYLPLAKLAIADTFFLEGTTSALIQAGQAYQDWMTFFPTHPLSDDVCLKMGEVEMRRMGLADRDISPARKAEQRLKACIQQYPKSSLVPEIQKRLHEVQENLADHDKDVGDQYFNRYYQKRASNLKGAQGRYREIVEKYPFYSQMAEVLFRLGVTYMEEEEPDEATKYFQQLVRTHPNSNFTEKAKEKLAAIGAQVPDTAPDAIQEEPTGPGFIGNMMQQISGTVPKTVNKNGVIISTSSKGGDIIEAVIENNGVLPPNFDSPTYRTGPARDVRPLPASTPAPKKDATQKKEVGASPANNGGDQSKPASTQQTTTTPQPSGNNGAKP